MKRIERVYSIAILSGKSDKLFTLLDNSINEELEKDTIPYLFRLLTDDNLSSLGKVWAKERGVNIYHCKSMKQLLFLADFIFFIIDKKDEDNKELKNIMMQFKMMENKHGKVILL